MKTTKKSDGLYVEEAVAALDVIYAGLAGLLSYYGKHGRRSVYEMKAFRMCEAFTSMVQEIGARDDMDAYHKEILMVLDMMKAASKEKPGNERGEETQDTPQGG